MKIAQLASVLILLFFLSCAGPSATKVAETQVGMLFPIAEGDSWGFINRNGDVVIPLEYEGAVDFSEGRALIKENGKWGYINEWNILLISYT